MTEPEEQVFEVHRERLKRLAFRMLGNAADADDAVQETWLRLDSAVGPIENLGGWLTIALSRLCLDVLRARRARPETTEMPEVPSDEDPESDLLLAETLDAAATAVLSTLGPAERVSFVLHDMFGVPFEEIALVLVRSVPAAKQLASRARRRFRAQPATDPRRQRDRALVEAFLDAARSGDLEGVVATLDPLVEVHARSVLLRGAPVVARQAALFARAAKPFALVQSGERVAMALASEGTLLRVLTFEASTSGITRIDVVDGRELATLSLSLLDPAPLRDSAPRFFED